VREPDGRTVQVPYIYEHWPEGALPHRRPGRPHLAEVNEQVGPWPAQGCRLFGMRVDSAATGSLDLGARVGRRLLGLCVLPDLASAVSPHLADTLGDFTRAAAARGARAALRKSGAMWTAVPPVSPPGGPGEAAVPGLPSAS